MIQTFRWAALSSVFAVVGCTDAALSQKVDDLEKRVVAIEEAAKAAPAPGKPAAPSAEDQAAMELFKAASDAARTGDVDGAKAKLAELNEKYKGSRAAGAGARLLAELSVVGSDAGELQVATWLAGKSSFDEGKATMLVFWEVWCPHCVREVPKLQATYEKYKPQGLNVVGLTKVSRGKTDADVLAFLEEKKVTYAIGKEDEAGTLSQRFGVNGVPAAAVVKGGKVVWRGHPAQVTDEMIAGWIN